MYMTHLEGTNDSVGNLHSNAFLSLGGGSAQVGRANHLGPVHQGAVCRGRLHIEDIKGSLQSYQMRTQ